MPRHSGAQQSDPVVITHGPDAGRVTLIAGGPFLRIRVEGEARGEIFVRCVREAVAQGIVHKNTCSLIDLTLFTGTVDWKALNIIRDMTPWGEGRETRVAYLVRNNRFGLVVKVVEVLFGGLRHRIFNNADEAIAWVMAAPAIAIEKPASGMAG